MRKVPCMVSWLPCLGSTVQHPVTPARHEWDSDPRFSSRCRQTSWSFFCVRGSDVPCLEMRPDRSHLCDQSLGPPGSWTLWKSNGTFVIATQLRHTMAQTQRPSASNQPTPVLLFRSWNRHQATAALTFKRLWRH